MEFESVQTQNLWKQQTIMHVLVKQMKLRKYNIID